MLEAQRRSRVRLQELLNMWQESPYVFKLSRKVLIIDGRRRLHLTNSGGSIPAGVKTHPTLSMSTGTIFPYIRWLAICIGMLRLTLVDSQSCNSAIYGTPNILDCYEALGWIPFSRMQPSYPPSLQLRVFSEPQYLPPPFASLNNPYRPEAIIQLPKIGRHSE